jgi:hypothetical protein
VFTEGWRGLDLGIGGFLGQFHRDTDARDKANERIRNYAADYGAKGEKEEHFEDRAKRLQETLRESGAIQRDKATPATAPPTGAATPAVDGASPAGGATAAQPGAAPAGGPTTATVVGAAAVGAAAGAGIATAASALHGERGSRGREREVPGADPTDVLAHLDDHDVEALASMLYGRMVTRFRKQLLIDRERSGFLTDFR